jgi:hypothetical protein
LIKVHDPIRVDIGRPVQQQDRQRLCQEYSGRLLVRDSSIDSLAVPTVGAEQNFGEFQRILAAANSVPSIATVRRES